MTNRRTIAFFGVGAVVGKNDATSQSFKGQPVISLRSMRISMHGDRA
jgi:hypothetical protein